MNDDLMNSSGYTPANEAKGSDVRCFYCGAPVSWDGQFWRHDVSTDDKQFMAGFCDKYGYPVPVRDASGKVRMPNER